MADNAALHAEIFGSDLDDDDDDEEYAPPEAADDDAGGDDDDKAEQILSKAKNNLLLGGLKKDKKKKEKAAPKESSKRSGKRKADGGDGEKRRACTAAASAAAATPGEAGGDAGGAAEGEEGGAGGDGAAAAGGDADDPDDDSVSGSEAVEEGGKNDFDRILSGLKAKRGGPNWSRDKLHNDVRELQERMESAVEEDDEAIRAEPPRPALAKIAMLPEVEAMMRKKQYHETMVDQSMLSTLARWLRPMPDGSLVSLQVRKGLLNALLKFEIDETVLGSLRSSGIGKYVKLLTLHKREIAENKRVATSLIEKWSRPIFRTSEKVIAADLPTAPVPRHSGAGTSRSAQAEAQTVGGALARDNGGQTANHARVPRPMGMDFSVLPASEDQALPSSKYAKESNKGRLQDRILHSKKRAATQAVTLSVEGRTLDRL